MPLRAALVLVDHLQHRAWHEGFLRAFRYGPSGSPWWVGERFVRLEDPWWLPQVQLGCVLLRIGCLIAGEVPETAHEQPEQRLGPAHLDPPFRDIHFLEEHRQTPAFRRC